MRIASFNANSIRTRTDIILDWLDEYRPDALCVQETKAMDKDFPVAAFEEAGYFSSYWGQKSYNGVAILTRDEPENVSIGFEGTPSDDEEARLIRVTIAGVSIVNSYIPQGTALDSPKFAYKLGWIRRMRDYFARDFQPTSPVVWVGDFNVAVEPIDLYDPDAHYGGVCYCPDEHDALSHVRNWGFTDVFRKHHPGEPHAYTFWDYRVPYALKRKLGWRLDHIWATESLAKKSIACTIDTNPRLKEKPSDHTFIYADFDA